MSLAGRIIRRLDEKLKIVNLKEYNTKFGRFTIKTSEGKQRGSNSFGKIEWKNVRITDGEFEDYPDVFTFFVKNNRGDKYVSSIQGNGDYTEFASKIGAENYGELISIVDGEVTKCFRDYYKDNSIR